jgi:hypothetical protein
MSSPASSIPNSDVSEIAIIKCNYFEGKDLSLTNINESHQTHINCCILEKQVRN